MPDTRTVLIVDDDIAVRQSLAEQLELRAEFVSLQCDSGAAALRLARERDCDAALIAADLPDISGAELCRRLRRAGMTMPIIMLAPAGGDVQAEPARAAGATELVTKPLRINLLLERLRAHVRRGDDADGSVLTIGPYAFRPNARLLSDRSGRKTVRLTDKEAAILIFLYRAGRTIGRETLLGEVWGYNGRVTTHTLETHVYRLRRKIERDPARAEILVTEPGGYRLRP